MLARKTDKKKYIDNSISVFIITVKKVTKDSLSFLQTALNIVKLGPGLAEVKSIDHNSFVIITSKKEYRYSKYNVGKFFVQYYFIGHFCTIYKN